MRRVGIIGYLVIAGYVGMALPAAAEPRPVEDGAALSVPSIAQKPMAYIPPQDPGAGQPARDVTKDNDSPALHDLLRYPDTNPAPSMAPAPNPSVSPPVSSGEDTPADGPVLARIDSLGQWESVADAPTSHTVAHAQIVKFVIDREDGGRLYLVNTRRWPIHYYFVRDRLQPHYPHAAFNEKEYGAPDRRYIMGSVVRYMDSGQWTLETIPGDTMDSAMLMQAYDTIRAAVFFGDQLKFRPQSAEHEARVAELAGRLPVLDENSFLQGLEYQPLTLGTAFGRLRVVRGDLDPATVREDDILVTENVPDDLPVCAGLVTSKFQAPLAHVSLLLGNRGTPNMMLKNAVDIPQLTAHDGQFVRFEVGAQDYKIVRAIPEDAKMWRENARPSEIVRPALTPRVEGVADYPQICDLNTAHIGYVGGKAAYLGALCAVKPALEMPGGFVVPVHAYLSHIAGAGLDGDITALGRDIDAGMIGDDDLAARLEKIRAAIAAAPVADATLDAVMAQMAAYAGKPVIIRSSANVEDVQGFSGAGLYESKVVKPDADAAIHRAALANGLRKVWASLWSLRAVKERAWYRIDSQNLAMAAIVQPFVEGLKATGVAITANPFTRLRPAVFINAQITGAGVTGAKDGETPESMLVYTYTDVMEPHILTRSSLNKGAPILSVAEADHLAVILKSIHDHFIAPQDAQAGAAMDVEFLVREDGSIVIVQARPYRVDFREK